MRRNMIRNVGCQCLGEPQLKGAGIGGRLMGGPGGALVAADLASSLSLTTLTVLALAWSMRPWASATVLLNCSFSYLRHALK